MQVIVASRMGAGHAQRNWRCLSDDSHQDEDAGGGYTFP
jgi:hypothetical protein